MMLHSKTDSHKGKTVGRDGDQDATPEALALWRSIVGYGDIGDPGYIRTVVKPGPAGASLDQISWYLGEDAEIKNHTFQEAIFRCGSYLSRSRSTLGFHGSLGEGLPDGDPARSGYGVLRRSGAMSLLELAKIRRAGLI